MPDLTSKISHTIAIASPFLICACVLLGCGKRNSLEQLRGRTMGTDYVVKFIANPQYQSRHHDHQKLKQRIEKQLTQFDEELSNWNKNSWVTQFNRSQSTEWTPAPEQSLQVLEACLNLHQKSRGAFDISISPLIELWGFGANGKSSFPSAQNIQKTLELVGSQQLTLDREKGRIKKEHPKLQINTSALAKGYGVDLIADLLERENIENYMVEIGGEVRCKGAAPNRMGWNIGIRKPNPKKGVGPSDIQQIVTLQNQSMATSGDYQNFFQHEGQRFSHILDPNTGYPVQHNLCSVTVVAPSCALADGLATACLVLGSKLSLEWIKLFPGCEIYMMERSEDDSIQSFHSKNFPLNSSSQNK